MVNIWHLTDTLKFAEVPEEIVIKSDVHIKQEVLEPLYDDYQYGDYQNYVEEENLNWFQESLEQHIESEKPLKKKKKRKKEPQIKSEGIFLTASLLLRSYTFAFA